VFYLFLHHDFHIGKYSFYQPDECFGASRQPFFFIISFDLNQGCVLKPDEINPDEHGVFNITNNRTVNVILAIIFPGRAHFQNTHSLCCLSGNVRYGYETHPPGRLLLS
jgi:hypothetical protein